MISEANQWPFPTNLIKIEADDLGTTNIFLEEITGATILLREINRSAVITGSTKKYFDQEIMNLLSISHPFIVSCYGTFSQSDNIYILFEFCSRGSLSDFFYKGGKLADNDFSRIICELLSAVEFLHSKSIVHRNINMDNIYIDENFNIRLGGFSYSANFETSIHLLKTQCGDLRFASPELIRGHGYSYPTDIWSLGVILYYLAFHTFPFQDPNTMNLISHILHNEPNFTDPSVPVELKTLIKGMLQKDPNQRYTFSDIISNPWITSSRFSNYIGTSFYSSPMYVIFPFNESEIDNEVISFLKSKGVNIDQLILDLVSKRRSFVTMLYEINRRTKVMRQLISSETRYSFKMKHENKALSSHYSPHAQGIKTGLQIVTSNRKRSDSVRHTCKNLSDLPLPVRRRTDSEKKFKTSICALNLDVGSS